MRVLVNSSRNKKEYLIERMKEYDVETSLDIPADYFKLVLSNPTDKNGNGLHSELFNPNDTFQISESYGTILDGISDDIDEGWDENGSYIEIIGRDKSLLLLENDAIPKTYYNLTLSSLIKQITVPYGFKTHVSNSHDKTIKKIVVESGMSEWDVIFEQSKKLGLWLWCQPDGTLIADKLNYNKEPKYKFSNDFGPDKTFIKMKRLIKKKRGADIKSEVWIRGHGKKAFTHKHKDDELSKLNYKRRIILEDGNIKDRSKAIEKAKETIKERKKGSYEIEIEINGNNNVRLNEVAQVIDRRTKLNNKFLIVGIKDTKSNTGTTQTIRLRPLWEGL